MERILVVDDDRTTRELLRLQLKSAGFAVETASDGADALARVRAKTFDLVLLDVWMPGMDGLSVLARMRDHASHPKVIVMTADDTSETLLRAIREHAYRYVTKPVEPKELVEIVRTTLVRPALGPAHRGSLGAARVGGAARALRP